MEKEGESNTEQNSPFQSRLRDGRDRFLAHVIEHGLEIGRRTPEDFIRHFPPAAIMKGLEHQPTLRSQILVLTTGIKQKIAMKKAASSAGEDLQIALDEGETDADSIVALFHPDDRVRYLDAKLLWAYVVEGEFWTATASKKDAFDQAKTHVAFMLDRAIEDKLITHRDIVDGISVEELAARLPKDKLGKIIAQALANAHNDKPFTEVDLLSVMPATTLVDYVPLGHIWDKVVVPRIALKHAYLDDSGETVKQALDWLEGDNPEKGQAEGDDTKGEDDKSESKGPKKGADGTDSLSSDGDVEITDDDIRIS
jgi:hypothetical protein